MDFDVLIATRNRQDVLEVSLPLMLAQSRLPKRLIVVDASDDHDCTRSVVERAAGTLPRVEPCVIKSEAGTSRQRNAGLECVTSDIVFMPDDDALWFPGFAEAIMRIYERDDQGLVGGVGGKESSAAPPNGRLSLGLPVWPGLRNRSKSLDNIFRFIEDRFIPDPLMLAALSHYQGREKPLWLAQEDAVLSGAMTGFRMSYRTTAIREVGFDEILGRYALFEDFDAGLGILKDYSIVRSGKAQVYHYRLPENRVNGREYGVMQILNRVYILGKHSPPGSAAWRAITRSSYYIVVRFLAKARQIYGRQCFVGAWKAAARMRSLFGIQGETLAQEYQRIRAACLA